MTLEESVKRLEKALREGGMNNEVNSRRYRRGQN